MEIVNKKVEDLIPYINNSRTHNEEQVNQIVASINEFGFTNPLLIDEKDNIIAGHGRLLASKKLNMEEVPCIVLKGLTEAQKKAYIIADNKLALNAGWDEELLKLELENLKELDFDISLTGFNIDELDDVFEEEQEVVEDDYEIELPNEPKSKLGDIYQLGNHRLMCGDSTLKENVNLLIGGGNKINCVFTSPPYNMASNMYETYEDNMDSRDYIDFNIKIVKAFLDKLDGFVFWNISYNKNSRKEFIVIANELMELMNFSEMIIWNKKKAMPILSKEILTRTYENIFMFDNIEYAELEIINLYNNNRGLVYNKRRNKIIPNYWEIIVDSKTQLENHKACFPVSLPARGIELTTIKGQNVYDPFGGSGTTLIACEQLERNCYMMELDPKYVDVIINRWETFTGQKAVLLNE